MTALLTKTLLLPPINQTFPLKYTAGVSISFVKELFLPNFAA